MSSELQVLTGRRLVVTGGASGIGAAAVIALARAGARLLSLDVSDDAGWEVIEKGGVSDRASFKHCDVSDGAAVDTVFEQAVTWLGGLDGVVHIAGVHHAMPAELIDRANWNRMLDVNARGTMHVNQAAHRYLRATGGAIANFSSSAGIEGLPGSAAYAASKAAILGWTRTVAREWGKFGIRVNAIAPGMRTPMYELQRALLSPQARALQDEGLARRVSLGGMLGDPGADMAPVLVFLMSDAARFITGQTICVDGGMVMSR